MGNRNAVGYGAPAKIKNAVKHGLFCRYLPAETLAIVEELEQSPPLDIFYDNILMQHAAIIRAQRIMYVKEQDDITKEIKKVNTSSTGKDGKKKMSEHIESIKKIIHIQMVSITLMTFSAYIYLRSIFKRKCRSSSAKIRIYYFCVVLFCAFIADGETPHSTYRI